MASEFLESVRKLLNETRQDRVCRAFMARKGGKTGIVPFLGATAPVYLFLGLNPAGIDIAEPPTGAEDFIDWATGYFSSPDTDRGSFASYLPLTSNQSGDYAAFGQVSMVTHLVPLQTQRSSEITLPLVKNCWPRVLRLLAAARPKLILCHGSLVWKFLTGLEEGTTTQLPDLPDELRHSVADLYERVEAERLPFQSRIVGLSDEVRPWFLPLVHLGGAGGGKDVRKKTELAAVRARRAMHAGPAEAVTTSVGPTRIRVRKPG